MPTIFLDECGFTGEDLTNEHQPVFVLAGHDLSEEVCVELKQRHFGSVRSAELKHMSLQKRPRQREMVLALMRELAEKYPNQVKCEVVHKRYVLLAKMVDLLAEPVAHREGVDLYERGANIGLTNLIWMTLPVFASQAFFDRTLVAFERMMRERTMETYDAFFRPLFISGYSKDAEELLVWFKAWHVQFGPGPLLSGPGGDLDVAFTSAFGQMSSWRKEWPLPTELNVIHDSSSNMAKEKPVWDALMDPNLAPRITGYDRRTREYPIAVKSTRFESSRLHTGLQIADVVAGAVARAATSLLRAGDDGYGTALVDIVNGTGFVKNAVWPSMAVTPADLGTDGPKYGDLADDTGAILKAAGVLFGQSRSHSQ